MARQPRNYYPGGLYHIMCRGNNGTYIFENDKDKKEYLDIIQRYKKRYGFKLYAYVIMDNHAHMLIEQEKVILSKIMQGIQQCYTLYYNKKYNQSGHVFEQRYKSIHCDKDAYLLSLIRYIHQNPVRAKLQEGFNYIWSSHHDYIRCDHKDFVETAFPLSLFNEDIKAAIEEYISFVGEDDIHIFKPDEAELKQENETIIYKPEVKIKNTLEEIADIVCSETGVKIKELRGKTRIKTVCMARNTFIWIVHEQSDISQKELAKFLNRSEAAISKVLKACYENKENRIIENAQEIANKLRGKA